MVIAAVTVEFSHFIGARSHTGCRIREPPRRIWKGVCGLVLLDTLCLDLVQYGETSLPSIHIKYSDNLQWAMQTADEIPKMPRAMKSSPVTESKKTGPSPETISPSLYRKLHLLRCISKYTAPKETNSKKHEDTSGPQRMKRSFLDEVAYLCDDRKDGSNVTVTMLQKRKKGGYALWVAANEGVKPQSSSRLLGMYRYAWVKGRYEGLSQGRRGRAS